MNIFKYDTSIKFVNKKYIGFAVSGLVILAGFFVYLKHGFNMGIDFSGGTMLEISYIQNTSVDQVRATLAKVGLDGAQIVRIGSENKFFIKVTGVATAKEISADHQAVARKIKDALRTAEEQSNLGAGKIDINNASEGDLARFLKDKGIEEGEADSGAKIITDLRKNATG